MQREIERKKLFESLGTQQDDLIADMESPLPSPIQDDQERPQDSDNNSFPEPSPEARDEVESHSNPHDELLVQRSEEPNSAANHAQVEEGIFEEASIVCSESETKEVQIISPEDQDCSVLEMNSNDFQEKQRITVVQVFDDDDDEPETQVQEITIQQKQQDLTMRAIIVEENSVVQETIQVQKEIVCIDLEDDNVLEVVQESVTIQEQSIEISQAAAPQIENHQQENIPTQEEVAEEEEGLKSPEHKKFHSEETTPLGTTEPAETAIERENTGNDQHSALTVSKDEEQNNPAIIDEEENTQVSINLFETGFKNQMPEESQEVPQLYQIRGLSESDAQNPIRMEVEQEAYAPNDEEEEDIPSPKSISSGKLTHSSPNQSPDKKSQESPEYRVEEEIEEVIASEQESWNEIEEACQIDIHLLQDKPGLEDVLKHLEEKKLAAEGEENSHENEGIQNEVERTYEWKTTYQQSLEQNDGSLKQVIDEIKSLHIKVDEMEHAYQHKKNWGLWRIKLVELAKKMKDEPVPIDQVKDLLEEESQVKYYKPADSFVNLLKEKYQRATQIETLLASELKPQELKSIVTELKHLRIQLPQESTLLAKVEINKDLEDLMMMNEKITVDDLETKINHLASRFDIANQELVESVQNKLALGKRLASQAEYLMVTKTQHSLEDLTQMVKLAKEAKAEKLKISGIEQMQVIIREFLIFERVREVLFYNRAITEQDLENGEYVLIEGETVEDIVAKSEKALEGSFELSEQELEKLEQISSEVDFEKLSSGLLQNFFKQLAIIVQKEKAKRLIEGDQKNTEQVAEFVSQIPYNPEVVREADKDYFARIQKENKMIAKWKESVQEFLRTCPEECLLSILDRSGEKEPDYGNITEELESLDKQAKQLEEEFNKDLSSYTDLQEENKVLKKITNWISWIYEALDLRRQIEDEQRAPDYSVLMTINQNMNETNLPLDRGLCGLISDWHGYVEKVKRIYIREYLPKRGIIKTDDVENLKVQRLGERNTGKLTIAHANEMLQHFKGVESIAILSEEVEAVSFDIKACRLWAMRVKEIIGDCEDLLDTKNIEEEEMQGQRSSIVEKHHLITKKLKELKTQMIEITLREEEAEKELAAFEWMCDAAFTLVGLRREYGYEEWKRLVREEEQLGIQVSENAEKLLNKIKEELLKADEIKGFVDRVNRVHEDMKQREKKGGEPNLEEEQEMKILIEDVSQVIGAFQRCKVPLREEKNSLENLHKRYHDTKAKLENILSPTGKKSVLSEFTEMKKQVRRLPIRMTEEYEELNDAIEIANILENEASNPRNRSDFQAMGDLVSKYQKCPVYIRDIEAIQKKYQDLKSGHEKLDEQKAKVIDPENTDLTYEELFDFDQALEKMPNVKFDQTLRRLKKNCFIKKCKILQKQTEETLKRPTTTITVSSLSMLVDDGKKFREEFSDDNLVSSCTSFIQALLRKVDDRVSDIRKERDEQKLENMPKIVLGYVDLSQEIIDQKASLKNLFIETKNYHYTEDEPRKVVEEPIKRKRGRPRKGEEKTPPKVKPMEKKSNKSKEESREREKYDNNTEVLRKKQPQAQEKSWVRPSQEAKPIKPIGQYFTSAPREGALIKQLSKQVDLKSASSIIGYLRDVLQSDGNYLGLEYTTCSKFAQDIIRAHPDMLESNEVVKKVRSRLRRLLQFKNVSRYLFIQTQNLKNIAIWFSKTPEELQAFEKKLTSRAQDSSKTKQQQQQSFADDARTKSPVPQRNTQIAAAAYRPSSPIPQRSKKEEQTTLQGLIRKEKQNESSRVVSSQPLSTSSQNIRKNLHSNSNSNTFDKSPIVERKTRIIQAEKLPAKEEKFESTMYDPWSDRFDNPPRNANHITRQDVKPQEKASISKIIEANPYAIKKKHKSSSKEYDPFGAGNDSHDEEASNSRGFSDLSRKRTEKEKKEAELRVQRLERIEASKAPEGGAILKIYEGSLEHVKDNQNIKVALYTCDAKRTVVKIPELDGNLKILKKIPTTNVEAYFEKTLNSREDRDLHIISGWIECSISLYQSRYEQIARDFLRNQEVGTATYGNESARIIFMHKDQLSPSWKSKLSFKTRKTSKTSNPILYFIILGKPEKYNNSTRFIAPAVEKAYEPKDFSAGKKSLEEFEQDYDQVSEGTSIEDFEPDFGVAVDDNDSLASLDENRAEPKKKVTIIDPKSLNTPPFGRKRKEVEFEDISDIKTKDYERKERKFPNQSYGDRLNNFNSQADKRNQYHKRGYESERDFSEENTYNNVTKKLKTELEDENDEILISKLKTMDQDEIMEYAKSIPANKRHTLISLLKTMDTQEHPRNEPAKQPYVPHTPESKRVPWYKQVLSQSPISYPALETQNLPFIHSSQPIIPTQPSPIASGLNRFSTASPFGKSLDLSNAYKPTESVTENLTLNNPPSIHHTPIKASQGLQGHKNNQVKRDFTPNNNNYHNKRFQQNSGSNSNDFNHQSRSPFNKKSFQQNQQYGGAHFKGNRNLNQNKENGQFSGFQANPSDLFQTLATNFNLGNLNFDQAGGSKTAMSQTKEFNSILQNDDQTIDSYFGSNTIIAQQKRNPNSFNNQRINQSQSQSGLNFLNTPLLSFNTLGK